MSLCKECRNFIKIIDSSRIQYEAHLFSVKVKSECEAYLNREIKDKKQIKYNNKVVSDIHSHDVEVICSP